MAMRRAAITGGVGVLVVSGILGGVFGLGALAPVPAGAGDAAPSQAIPVNTATARIQDVPVYLDGLGTVRPLNVVEIKAQVDGTLIALPVKEGAEVIRAT